MGIVKQNHRPFVWFMFHFFIIVRAPLRSSAARLYNGSSSITFCMMRNSIQFQSSFFQNNINNNPTHPDITQLWEKRNDDIRRQHTVNVLIFFKKGWLLDDWVWIWIDFFLTSTFGLNKTNKLKPVRVFYIIKKRVLTIKLKRLNARHGYCELMQCKVFN